MEGSRAKQRFRSVNRRPAVLLRSRNADRRRRKLAADPRHSSSPSSFLESQHRDPDVLDDESLVDAVLAFQRWRQLGLKVTVTVPLINSTLKRKFSQELREVLEEARRDEASLSLLQQELQRKEENLSRALADSAQLRAHISATEAAVSSNYGGEVHRKAEERVAAAEEEVGRREKEIVKLKQRVQYFEDEKARLDSNLQAQVSLLQHEKTGLVKENRALLDQLSRRDQELQSQVENIEKLESKVASMSEVYIKLGRLHSEQEAARALFESRIKQEQDGRIILEKDLAVAKAECQALTKEKENLNLQLDKALEKTSAFSDSLLWRIQSTSEGHVKSSEAIAAGISEHLKVLTGHVTKLASSFKRITRVPASHRMDENMEVALVSFKPTSLGTVKDSRKCSILELPSAEASSGCRLVQTVFQRLDATTQTTGFGDGLDLGVTRWVAWKWRWFSALLKSSALEAHSSVARTTQQGSDLAVVMERELQFAFPGQSLVAVLLAIWKEYRKARKSERGNFMKNVPIEKVMTVLPWWVRRVGEKRRLERSFLQWHMRAKKRQAEEFYFHPHSCLRRQSSKEFKRRLNSRPACENSDAAAQARKNFEPERSMELVKLEKRQLVLTPSSYLGSTFTARALRTLQVSLQQEFQDLQILLAKEMEAVQSQVMFEGDAEDSRAAPRQRMTFLWEVCNKLANALMEAHKQLVTLDRVYDYVEISGGIGRQQQQQPKSLRVRAADCSRKRQGYVNVTTAKTPIPQSTPVSKKRNCIASQCAAILQSELKRFAAAASGAAQLAEGKGSMALQEFVSLTRA